MQHRVEVELLVQKGQAGSDAQGEGKACPECDDLEHGSRVADAAGSDEARRGEGEPQDQADLANAQRHGREPQLRSCGKYDAEGEERVANHDAFLLCKLAARCWRSWWGGPGRSPHPMPPASRFPGK